MMVQVMERLDSLQAERDRMEEQWKTKQSWLEAVHLEQLFYRDVNAMDKTSNSQEVAAGEGTQDGSGGVGDCSN